MYFDIQCVKIKILKRKYIVYPSSIRFSATVVKKGIFNFVSNFQCNSVTVVITFCTSGTLVKKVIDKVYSVFDTLKSGLSRLKSCKVL